MNYKVVHLIDQTYQVIEFNEELGEIVHQGGLADCEAFIRLKEGGYL